MTIDYDDLEYEECEDEEEHEEPSIQEINQVVEKIATLEEEVKKDLYNSSEIADRLKAIRGELWEITAHYF